jgi:hypothetical protein
VDKPARRLLGRQLDGGWKVIEEVALGPEGTGGHFSAGYIVERPNGERAYLKGIGLLRCFRAGC